MRAAGGHHAVIQLLDLSACRLTRNGQGNQEILGSSPHGGDVAKIGGCGPKPDVGEGGGAAVEMDAHCKEIGRQQVPVAAGGDHCGVVADAADNTGTRRSVPFLERPDQVEFTDR